ncbi:MAG: ATP phosphoribosyltransferase [Candidatus Paceibacterota bacterium]|jgi:ATP phosphoribosyltransferase
MKSNKLKIALPAGSLKESTFELLKKAGYKINVKERSYFPIIDDEEIECMLIRAQEIPKYVEQGKFDVGITGKDWVEESGNITQEIGELKYSKQGFNSVKLVIAVPESSDIKTIQDLEGKTISTELVNVTRKFLEKNEIKANVEFSWGATESKPPYLADAIAELSDSGSSLRANNLRVIGTVMESTTRIVANKQSYKNKWKRQKSDLFVTLLKSALAAEGMVGLKMNAPKEKTREIIECLSALRKPTISTLTEKNWCSIEVILPEMKVKNIISEIRKLGAEGIVQYPINKIIY